MSYPLNKNTFVISPYLNLSLKQPHQMSKSRDLFPCYFFRDFLAAVNSILLAISLIILVAFVFITNLIIIMFLKNNSEQFLLLLHKNKNNTLHVTQTKKQF